MTHQYGVLVHPAKWPHCTFAAGPDLCYASAVLVFQSRSSGRRLEQDFAHMECEVSYWWQYIKNYVFSLCMLGTPLSSVVVGVAQSCARVATGDQ